jgi:hypothetical protein
MGKKYLLFFIAFLINYSCKHPMMEGEIEIGEINKVVYLKASEIYIPPVLLRPSSLCLIDSFMIVSQSRQDTLFSIFGLPECKLLKCFGIKGRGPNEFDLSFQNVTLGSVHSMVSTFAVGNHMNDIQYYKIDDILNNNFIPYKIEKLPPKLNGFQSIGYINDTIIIGAPYGENMQLFKYSCNRKILSIFKEYPIKFPLMNNDNKRRVFGCYMAIDPDNSRIALSYSNIGCIDICDIRDNRKLTLSFKEFPSLTANLGIDKNSKEWKPNLEQLLIFSWDIEASERYIYVKIYNKHYSEISDSKTFKRDFVPELFIFDWSGKPVLRLRLDNFFTHYVPDRYDKYLYAIDDNFEGRIYRYDLRGIFE